MLLETQKKLTEQMKMINEYTYLDVLICSMLNPAELRSVNADWERELHRVSIRNLYNSQSEMIQNEMDSIMSGMDPNLEEEEDDEINKVLMEVAGIQLNGMSLVPAGKPKVKQEDIDVEKWLRENGLAVE